MKLVLLMMNYIFIDINEFKADKLFYMMILIFILLLIEIIFGKLKEDLILIV